MATPTTPPRRKTAWWEILLQLTATLLPVVIGAVSRDEADEAPTQIHVRSEEGKGNISVVTYPPISLSKALEISHQD